MATFDKPKPTEEIVKGFDDLLRDEDELEEPSDKDKADFRERVATYKDMFERPEKTAEKGVLDYMRQRKTGRDVIHFYASSYQEGVETITASIEGSKDEGEKIRKTGEMIESLESEAKKEEKEKGRPSEIKELLNIIKNLLLGLLAKGPGKRKSEEKKEEKKEEKQKREKKEKVELEEQEEIEPIAKNINSKELLKKSLSLIRRMSPEEAYDRVLEIRKNIDAGFAKKPGIRLVVSLIDAAKAKESPELKELIIAAIKRKVPKLTSLKEEHIAILHEVITKYDDKDEFIRDVRALANIGVDIFSGNLDIFQRKLKTQIDRVKNKMSKTLGGWEGLAKAGLWILSKITPNDAAELAQMVSDEMESDAPPLDKIAGLLWEITDEMDPDEILNGIKDLKESGQR